MKPTQYIKTLLAALFLAATPAMTHANPEWIDTNGNGEWDPETDLIVLPPFVVNGNEQEDDVYEPFWDDEDWWADDEDWWVVPNSGGKDKGVTDKATVSVIEAPQNLPKTGNALADAALADRGSTRKASGENRKDAFSIFGVGKFKCNLFVYEKQQQSGIAMPLSDKGFPLNTAQLTDGNRQIEGWSRATAPQAGDVIIEGGHMGIVYSNEFTISAASSGPIVVNNWGFRQGQEPTFWRYTGEGK